MRKIQHFISLVLILSACALTAKETSSEYSPSVAYKHSVGSSLFLLGNIDSGKPVYYAQLNYGFSNTPKSNILVEATTWTYYEPLGTYGNSDELYPGKVFAIGMGLGYQQFVWKRAFVSGVATPFLQSFFNDDGQKLQDGFQLYIQGTAGYRLEFFSKRWFFDPAFGITFWPVNTNFPADFARIEKGKPKYKLEPRANFGFRF